MSFPFIDPCAGGEVWNSDTCEISSSFCSCHGHTWTHHELWMQKHTFTLKDQPCAESASCRAALHVHVETWGIFLVFLKAQSKAGGQDERTCSATDSKRSVLTENGFNYTDVIPEWSSLCKSFFLSFSNQTDSWAKLIWSQSSGIVHNYTNSIRTIFLILKHVINGLEMRRRPPFHLPSHQWSG